MADHRPANPQNTRAYLGTDLVVGSARLDQPGGVPQTPAAAPALTSHLWQTIGHVPYVTRRVMSFLLGLFTTPGWYNVLISLHTVELLRKYIVRRGLYPEYMKSAFTDWTPIQLLQEGDWRSVIINNLIVGPQSHFFQRRAADVVRFIKRALVPSLPENTVASFIHKLRLSFRDRLASGETYPHGPREESILKTRGLKALIKNSCRTAFRNIIPKSIHDTTNAHEAEAVVRRRIRAAIAEVHRHVTSSEEGRSFSKDIYEYQSSANQSLSAPRAARIDVNTTDMTTYPVQRTDPITADDFVCLYDTAGPAGYDALNSFLMFAPAKAFVLVGESHDFSSAPTASDFSDRNHMSVVKELSWEGDKVKVTVPQHGAGITTYVDELTNLGHSERICVHSKVPLTQQEVCERMRSWLLKRVPPDSLSGILIHIVFLQQWDINSTVPGIRALFEQSVYHPNHPGSLSCARVFDVVNQQAGNKSISFLVEVMSVVGFDADEVICDDSVPQLKPEPVRFLDCGMRRIFYQLYLGPKGPALTLQTHTPFGCTGRVTVLRSVLGPLIQKGETNNWNVRAVVTSFTQAADTPGILTDSLKDPAWTKTQYEIICDFFKHMHAQEVVKEMCPELSFTVGPTVSSCSQGASVTKELVMLIDLGLKITSVPMNTCDVERSIETRILAPGPTNDVIEMKFVDSGLWKIYKQLSYARAKSLARGSPENNSLLHPCRPVTHSDMVRLLERGYDDNHWVSHLVKTSCFNELYQQALEKGPSHANKLVATMEEDTPHGVVYSLNGAPVTIDPITGTLTPGQFTAKGMVKNEVPGKDANSIARIVVNFACGALTQTKEVGVIGKQLCQAENAGIVLGNTPTEEKEMLLNLINGFPTAVRATCLPKQAPFLYRVPPARKFLRRRGRADGTTQQPDTICNSAKLLHFIGFHEVTSGLVDATSEVLLADYSHLDNFDVVKTMSSSLLSSADFSAFDASQCDAVSAVIFQELFKNLFHTDAAIRQTMLEELLNNARIVVESFDSEDGIKRGSFNPRILNPDGRTNGNLSGNGRTTFRNNVINSIVSYRAIHLFLLDLRSVLLESVKGSGHILDCPPLALYGTTTQVSQREIDRALIKLCPILFPHMFLISGDDNVTCCPMTYMTQAAEEVSMKVGLECDIFRNPSDPYRQEVNFLAKKYHFTYDEDIHRVHLVCSYPLVLRALRKMTTSAPHRWPGSHIGFAFISAAMGRFVQMSQPGSCGPVPILFEMTMLMTVIGLSLLKKSHRAQYSSPADIRSFIESEAAKGSEVLTVYADRNLKASEKLGYYDRLLQTVASWTGLAEDKFNGQNLSGQRFFYVPDGPPSMCGLPVSLGDGSALDELVQHDLTAAGFDPDLLLAFSDVVRSSAFTNGMYDIPSSELAHMLKHAPKCSQEMEELKDHASRIGLSMFYTQPVIPDDTSRRITLEVVRPSRSASECSDLVSICSTPSTASNDSSRVVIKENGKPESFNEFHLRINLTSNVSKKSARNRYDFQLGRLRGQRDLARASSGPEVTNTRLDVQASSSRGGKPSKARLSFSHTKRREESGDEHVDEETDDPAPPSRL